MATAPIPASEVQASISPFGRVLGVLFSPGKTFEDIVRKPSWITPVLVSTLLSIIAVVALNQRMNWRDYIVQQIEKSPRGAQLSADQKQQQAETGAKVTVAIVYASGLLVPVCFALLVGLVMMGAYNLLAGAGSTFSTAFSIVGEVAGGALQVVRFFHVLDSDSHRHWFRGCKPEKTEGRQVFHHCLQRLGCLCGLPRGLGVYLLLIH